MTISVLLALTFGIANAQDTGWDGFVDPPVVGGTAVPAGEWNDTVLVTTRDSICTGTLIGPTTVLTAAHCNDGIQGVVVGTKNYYDQSQGTYYAKSGNPVSHPSYASSQWGGYDIAVVRLANPVTGVEPRAFAVDCAAAYIQDGNDVQIVGFGSTQANGGGNNALLNEATTVITDHDCSEDYYCDPNMNNGEITAGAGGIDSCFGDSGGPLYLDTPWGHTLLGVTSRAGSTGGQPCGGGGIYTRADTFMSWIQAQTSDTLLAPSCNEPPIVTFDPFAEVGNKGTTTTRFTIVDPDSASWTYELAVPPANGSIAIGSNNQTLNYTGDEIYIGLDEFTFRVIDDAGNAVDVTVPLAIVEGRSGCNCATGSTPVGLWTLGLAGLLIVRRRQD